MRMIRAALMQIGHIRKTNAMDRHGTQVPLSSEKHVIEICRPESPVKDAGRCFEALFHNLVL